ncbi:uncharacterized protein ASCRUDRAFT_82858 [Ascoidea rubescens DSM 1968]|uniref:Uncharacterized protein n=1 Tax=Ascoidea rubescens DSM 1968 TaxID=1344418 RepID=A0A1D2V9X2_9ASCO|nr:hypothetical protein ASCRUDRAFT_82858 [Ascoidea rubescens DSM 1968]ODV58263.1 hypothetical protein ASCRUDRAFT_82858 [Ascoidea rubescens DSM 1968]
MVPPADTHYHSIVFLKAFAANTPQSKSAIKILLKLIYMFKLLLGSSLIGCFSQLNLVQQPKVHPLDQVH